MEVEMLHEAGQFSGLFGPLKSTGSLCCGVGSKRDHSVVKRDKRHDSATATADWDAPDWTVSYYIVLREKNPPPAAAFRQNSLTTCFFPQCKATTHPSDHNWHCLTVDNALILHNYFLLCEMSDAVEKLKTFLRDLSKVSSAYRWFLWSNCVSFVSISKAKALRYIY